MDLRRKRKSLLLPNDFQVLNKASSSQYQLVGDNYMASNRSSHCIFFKRIKLALRHRTRAPIQRFCSSRHNVYGVNEESHQQDEPVGTISLILAKMFYTRATNTNSLRANENIFAHDTLSGAMVTRIPGGGYPETILVLL
jgi:hypothetical protein